MMMNERKRKGTDMDAQFDAEKFNALMKLADFRFQRWKERRATDWQLSLALWTLLVVAAAYLFTHRTDFSGCARWMMAFGVIILVIGHALFWARTNFNTSVFDIRTGFHFTDQAVNLVQPDNAVPVEPLPDRQQFENSHRWSNFLHRNFWEFLYRGGFCQAQVFITAFFAFVVFVTLV
jgi:hypothetical protein